MNELTYETTATVQRRERAHIPYKEMIPGQSVFRSLVDFKEETLRSAVSNINNRSEYVFRIAKHKNINMVEIACCTKIPTKIDYSNQIVDSSEKAKAIIDKTITGKRVFPFRELVEGMSFLVPIAEANEKSLIVQCCTQSKKLGRRFVCIKHEEYGVFEIACVVKRPIQFFEPSPQMQAKVAE